MDTSVHRVQDIEIQLLGDVRVTVGGEDVEIGAARSRTVLAALALSAGSAVPQTRLIELVWHDRPPRSAEKSLQTYLSRLRKVLGRGAILRTGAAYSLALPTESVDAVRFDHLIQQGRFAAALAEWRGPPLAGIDAPGLAGPTTQLTEMWLWATEADLLDRLEADPQAVAATTASLTTDFPFREGLWALHMQALYRLGRQADALKAYGRARQQLVDQLGVEPGRRLQQTHARILDHDAELELRPMPNGPSHTLPTGTVTFAFADIEARLGTMTDQVTAGAEILRTLEDLVLAEAERWGGHVFARGGGSVGIAFDGVADASNWAAALLAEVDELGQTGGPSGGIRIGMHSGEAAELGGDYHGPAVVTAARIASIGHIGQMLVSGATAGLLDGVELRHLGLVRLVGVPGPCQVLQVGHGDHGPLRVELQRRGNIPRSPRRLIGRDGLLPTVREAMGRAQLVTLVGPGGVGKTRLALEVARDVGLDLIGGAWFVDLAGIADGDGMVPAIADVIGHRPDPGGTPMASLLEALEARRCLLVLDNCEHIVDAAADLTTAIVERCEHVQLLATSREALATQAELILPTPPLDATTAGVELFVERAQSADPSFDHDAWTVEVGEICLRLDGLPLAIELAAARIRTLSPDEIVSRLRDRFRLLAGGRRASVERHRALESTISWSYDLLQPVEQILFRRLSVFSGPFEPHSAAAIAAGPDLLADDIERALESLVDKSMVTADSGPFGRRYRLLETMRHYAAGRLAAASETDDVASRHAQWCATEIAHINRLLATIEENEGVVRLEELWTNLRAAIEWACTKGDPGLANSLVSPVRHEGFWRGRSEIFGWAETVLELPGASDDSSILIDCLETAASRYRWAQNPAGYRQLIDRYRPQPEPRLRFQRALIEEDWASLSELGQAAAQEHRAQENEYSAANVDLAAIDGDSRLGRFDEATAAYQELAQRCENTGPPSIQRLTYEILRLLANAQSDAGQAVTWYERAAAVQAPDRTFTLSTLYQVIQAADSGRFGEALSLLKAELESLSDNGLIMPAIHVGSPIFAELMARLGRLDDLALMAGVIDSRPEVLLQSAAAESFATLNLTPDDQLDQQREVGRKLNDLQAIDIMLATLQALET